MTDILLVTGLVAGGVGRHVNGLASGLVEVGHTVRVACPPLVASRFAIAQTGADVVPVDIGSRPSPRRDRVTAHTLHVAMDQVDVVHAHGLRAGALALMGRGADREPPVVVTSHNAAPESRLAAVLHRGLERMVCQGTDLFLGVSEDLVERARERGAADVGRAVVAAVRAEPTVDRTLVREELGLPADQLLVVSVGRLAAQKAFDRLLDALADEALAGIDFQVVIAGDGPQREALQRQIDRRGLPVTLLGHRNDVPDLLAAADLTVSSARWEGQPVWLQEALSVGAPVVATDVGGTAEVLDGGGLLVPGDDPAALARTMADVLTDPEEREQLRTRALTRATELPRGPEVVEAALTAYRRAAARTRSLGDVD